MTHSFKVGDRVVSVSDVSLGIKPGDIFVLTGVGVARIFFDDIDGDDRMREAHKYALAPALAAPAAPFAVSSKPRPKAPIKPGSRHEQVLNHLLTGKTLTQGEGIVLGYGTRVAATVHDLRRRGHEIVTTMKEDLHGSPYAEYRLVTRRANGNRKAA